MQHLIRISFGLFLVIFSNQTIAEDCNENCQLAQVKTYFSALDKISKAGSTTSDIEALLALTHEDVKYLHVEYQANFTKDTWRKAFERNLGLERYQKTEKNQIRILNSIKGNNHIAIEYSHGLIDDDGKWEPTNKYLALFGFKDGKIVLVRELW